MSTSEAMQKVLSYALEHSPCILCGSPPVWGGAFIPDKSNGKRYGAKPGKGRALGYALCEKCKGLSDVKDQVEALLLFQVKRNNGSKSIRTFSQDRKEELSELLKGQPCSLCNSLTDNFLQRELNPQEGSDLGIRTIVIPVCKSCMENPGVYDRLEENLRKLRAAKQKKPGRVLSMRSKRKRRRKK